MQKVLWAAGVLVLIVVFLLGAFVGWAVAQESETQRPIGDIRKDVKAFVKRSKSKDADEKASAIFDLCLLHREIVADARYQTDDNLVSFRAVVMSRLKDCKKEIELVQLREARRIKREAAAQKRGRGNDDIGSDEFFIDSEHEALTSLVLAEAMAEQMHTVGQMTGGPTQIFNYANGNFGPGNADDLIQLIEKTISPDSWESNGGNGRMFFYRPACALVVSASADVQDRISDLLKVIRDTSR